jgi:hypothetical protein
LSVPVAAEIGGWLGNGAQGIGVGLAEALFTRGKNRMIWVSIIL